MDSLRYTGYPMQLAGVELPMSAQIVWLASSLARLRIRFVVGFAMRNDAFGRNRGPSASSSAYKSLITKSAAPLDPLVPTTTGPVPDSTFTKPNGWPTPL